MAAISTRIVNLSPALAKIAGVAAAPRSEITKRIWVYIKVCVCGPPTGTFIFQLAVSLQEHKLQDPTALRTIFADSDLGAVVGIAEGHSFDYLQVCGDGRRRACSTLEDPSIQPSDRFPSPL